MNDEGAVQEERTGDTAPAAGLPFLDGRRRRIRNPAAFQAALVEGLLVLRRHGFARSIPADALARLGLRRSEPAR